MIKYATLKNFNNLGEFIMMSHIYRFHRKENNKNLFIIINAYIDIPKIWIGYLDANNYQNVKLNEIEEKYIMKELEIYVGEMKRINDLKEFSRGTDIENDAKRMIMNE